MKTTKPGYINEKRIEDNFQRLATTLNRAELSELIHHLVSSGRTSIQIRTYKNIADVSMDKHFVIAKSKAVV